MGAGNRVTGGEGDDVFAFYGDGPTGKYSITAGEDADGDDFDILYLGDAEDFEVTYDDGETGSGQVIFAGSGAVVRFSGIESIQSGADMPDIQALFLTLEETEARIKLAQDNTAETDIAVVAG